MRKEYTQNIKLEGDYLIASFLIEKNLLNINKSFLSELIKIVEKYKLRFKYIHEDDIKIPLNLFLYKNGKVYRIYFFGIFGHIKTTFALDFFDCYNQFMRIDFIAQHFDLVEAIEQKDSARVEKNLIKFSKIAEDIYLFTKPFYALIGQEEFVPSIEDVIRGERQLPHFWAFYSKSLIDIIGHKKLYLALKDSYIFKKLKDGGIFFALTRWNKISSKKENLKVRKNKLLRILNKNEVKKALKTRLENETKR